MTRYVIVAILLAVGAIYGLQEWNKYKVKQFEAEIGKIETVAEAEEPDEEYEEEEEEVRPRREFDEDDPLAPARFNENAMESALEKGGKIRPDEGPSEREYYEVIPGERRERTYTYEKKTPDTRWSKTIVRYPERKPQPEQQKFDREGQARDFQKKDGVERELGYRPTPAAKGEYIDNSNTLPSRKVTKDVPVPKNIGSAVPGVPAIPGVPVLDRSGEKKTDPRAPVNPKLVQPTETDRAQPVGLDDATAP